MNIETELEKIASAKNGNKEMALFFFPGDDMPWRLDVGNENVHVLLGEIEGEISVEGATVEEVINKMKSLIGI